MKPDKIPKLRIVRPFSTNVEIKPQSKILIAAIKIFVACLIVIVLAIVAYFLFVHYDQKNIIDKKVMVEQQKGANGESGIVNDATAAIITREGNVPSDVAKKYATWVFNAGATYSVDPLLILAVMSVESKFNYRAISPTGPIGLLQIAFSWHKEKTTQAGLFDPKNNIYVGAQILKEYSDMSSTEIETLLRYNGSLGHSSVYAVKVLNNKRKYSDEIMSAIVKSL